MADVQLTELEMEELRGALLSAFLREANIEELLYFRLGEHLNQLVRPGTYRNKVSDLVRWAAEQGRLKELIEKAHQANPGNARLTQFYDGIETRLKTASGAGSSRVNLDAENIQPLLTVDPSVDLQALIFGRPSDTRLPKRFFEQAVSISRSIALLKIPRIFNGKESGDYLHGTGWLIGQGLIITNHHVIDARHVRYEEPASPDDFEAQGRSATFIFDYEGEGSDSITECTGAKLVVNNKQLDYVILDVSEAYKVLDRQPLRIASAATQLRRGTRLNVVQHSGGKPLSYAIRNNFYAKEGSRAAVLLYQTDTEPGASGSPVCTDTWEVVALHRASSKVDPIELPQEEIVRDPITVTVLNEAVKMQTILESLPAPVREAVELEQAELSTSSKQAGLNE